MLLLPTLLTAAVVTPWARQAAELDEAIAVERGKIKRLHSLLAELPVLEAELERERNNDETKAFYFDAPTEALASARLQSELQQMVEAAGGQLTSRQILPADTDEQPPKIRVRVRLRAETPALRDLLYAIETARPFMFVDQLSIRSLSRSTSTRSSSRARRGRLRANSNTGEIDVRQLEVFGYWLGEAS